MAINLDRSKNRSIRTPEDESLDRLCDQLAEFKLENRSEQFPAEQLRLCGQYDVFRWFLPEEFGGFGWSTTDLTRGYLKLSAACLTTTFVITQRTAACIRLVATENDWLRSQLLPDLATGDAFTTVGISHLSTSRQHESKPVLRAKPTHNGIEIDGFSPWVTGSCAAQHIVMGATADDGMQYLFALPTDVEGVLIDKGHSLVGLSGSHTSAVHCSNVRLDQRYVLRGPEENVMASGSVGGTGGYQTSTLALGLASAAIKFLSKESDGRSELASAVQELSGQHADLRRDLFGAIDESVEISREELRARANSLVLRSTQAALVAAKGAGYVAGHPVGRWCQEAMFFLVWSCPHEVRQANLNELARITR